MASLGVQMMMLRQKVASEGMWPTLQRVKELGYDSVEVS